MIDFSFLGEKPPAREVSIDHETLRIFAKEVDAALIVADRDCRVIYLNPTAERLTEVANKIAGGRRVSEVFSAVLTSSTDGAKERGESLSVLDHGNIHFDSATLRTLSGKVHSIKGQIVAIPTPERGGETLIIFHDVGALRRAENALIYRSAYDPLTGLLNRREFIRRLDKLVDLDPATQPHILLYLDLDQFKIVNATCGHLAGDRLLRQVSELLHHHVRSTDILGRLGGDKFGIALESCSLGDGRRIADQILWAVQSLRFVWDGKNFATGVSIGMVAMQTTDIDVVSWLRDANAACYAAKDEGRNHVHLLGERDAESRHHAGGMNALAMVHNAIAHDRFLLYAQPIMPLADSSRDLPHMEVLLRLLDERGDIVLPGVFLPAAERYQQMPLIDRWVITHTFSMLQRLGISTNYIFAINLSGQSISRIDFLQFVIESLDQFGIPPQNLCFEITEGVAITNIEQAGGFMSVLGARGCLFALDDFGVGMSSLSYLRRLRIDYLKIDGSFIRNLANDSINTAMIRAIQTVAHMLGVKTIAECVETASDIQPLRAMGIDLVQGYLIAQPMPLEELCQLDFTEMDIAIYDCAA
jgi:diguanylate cyclase (GGDEF)-like protein